jgi:hypothetical protein
VSGTLRSRLFSVSNPREVWLITVAHAVNEFYSVALPPILPLLVNDFAISYAEAGGLLTVFYVVYSVFQLPAGALADRIGQRWILAIGMVVLSGGILLAAGAQDYRTLVFAEALAGLGGSTYHPAGMSLISDLEGTSTEGKAMGIHGLGGVVGLIVANIRLSLLGPPGAEGSIDHVVPVTVSRSPGDWVNARNRRAGDSTARTTHVNVDGLSRSTATSTGASTSAVTVETVTDLTELGTKVTDVVRAASANGERVGACVYSLTDLLQYVDRRETFFFVTTLANCIRRADGIAYFHLDPHAHDEETIDVFRTACDAVFEAEGDAMHPR